MNSEQLELYLDVPHVGVDGVNNGGQNVEVEVWGTASLCSERENIFLSLFGAPDPYGFWIRIESTDFPDPENQNVTHLTRILHQALPSIKR